MIMHCTTNYQIEHREYASARATSNDLCDWLLKDISYNCLLLTIISYLEFSSNIERNNLHSNLRHLIKKHVFNVQEHRKY